MKRRHHLRKSSLRRKNTSRRHNIKTKHVRFRKNIIDKYEPFDLDDYRKNMHKRPFIVNKELRYKVKKIKSSKENVF